MNVQGGSSQVIEYSAIKETTKHKELKLWQQNGIYPNYYINHGPG